jgi:structural maintenance of chromosome 2
MIKTHFPQSQFIVVSLKEGMFNNANIIFRTKFVDGVSTVARTVPALADRPASAPNAKGAMATKAAAKDTSKRQRRDKENAEPVA